MTSNFGINTKLLFMNNKTCEMHLNITEINIYYIYLLIILYFLHCMVQYNTDHVLSATSIEQGNGVSVWG